MENFTFYDQFINRHIGPSENEIQNMLQDIGVESLEELVNKTVPENIHLGSELTLPSPYTEKEILDELECIAKKNKVFKTYIGMGYYPTILPSVIRRNILENPGWYTSYTPYQAEISQGRMEALLNFQTVISDLTGLPIANSSLLDEGTAAAEAMLMFFHAKRGKKKTANIFLVSEDTFPQTIDVLKSRAIPRGIELKITPVEDFKLTEDVFGIFVQYPTGAGKIINYEKLFRKASEQSIFKVAAADLLSLALLKPPGEFGADAVVGSSQRFGVPMGYGGPHAAYFASTEELKRFIPGRIIGISKDSKGKPALRMALQTREQHIKRERATSNICTAQALLATMAGMYVVYHGPEGIKRIAERIHNLTKYLDLALEDLGLKQENKYYFDTLKVNLPSKGDAAKIHKLAKTYKVNLRFYDSIAVGVTIDETTTFDDLKILIKIFAEDVDKDFNDIKFNNIYKNISSKIPNELKRKSSFMTHPVFHRYHSETEMMRYIKSLENKDLSLTTSMIPLGSCTMKLNAATELIPITWPEFSNIHPFVPLEQAEGYQNLIKELEKYLCQITGFSAVSFQPNSGAQGEYAGLMTIREYHISKGEGYRNIVLIPSSAHGTNPASAVMAGNEVVIVDCDEQGNIRVDDLKQKAEENKDKLSALMVTYPSTHGIFEESIKEVCQIVHDNGGLVHMDGANLNAQLGLTSPKEIGADVCHLNLHKTFAIPHGGGGPGVGPIAVAKHLVRFLPGSPIVDINKENSIHAVSAAPWGSANILQISYAFIKMLGAQGIKKVAEIAILNANYLKAKLEPYYKVLYKGKYGFVGHELIFDTRAFKTKYNIDVIDIAKRLMDYGYHAPTVSFPVHGTLMVEPTESESKHELDKFCSAMISIKNEIDAVANGIADKDNNVLKNSPHTTSDLLAEWNHPYSVEEALFPADWCKENKFWVPINRIDDAYGDRHLFCTCAPIEDFEKQN